ncbi:MAG TPA: homocysteine S-methyltransferase family protein [Gaiellales bacterium]|jgi:homocysteine S-methyltransferase
MKLTDAGMETELIFEQGIDLPHFAAFPLVDTPEGRAALHRYYAPFLELARDRGAGFVLSAPTWRANADWGVLLGYDADALAAINRRAVAFAEALRDEVLEPGERDGVIVEGHVGPRSDAYLPTMLMRADEAERYHAVQLRTLADTGCRQIAALTLAYSDEAIGIVRAADAVGLPAVISFTVETDGRLASGESIEDAITAVDDATDGVAAAFMINCAHPTHFADALPQGDARLRIRGLRANASRLSHAELDVADAIDAGDASDLAARCVALRDQLPQLEVLGGCCGTDIGHVTAICDAWLAAV